MSPTYEVEPRFWRDFDRLTPSAQRQFLGARRLFLEGLRERPPRFAPALRVKRVQGHPAVWELTWAPDGRATFGYGRERRAGEAHVIWRRIGDHSILDRP